MKQNKLFKLLVVALLVALLVPSFALAEDTEAKWINFTPNKLEVYASLKDGANIVYPTSIQAIPFYEKKADDGTVSFVETDTAYALWSTTSMSIAAIAPHDWQYGVATEPKEIKKGANPPAIKVMGFGDTNIIAHVYEKSGKDTGNVTAYTFVAKENRIIDAKFDKDSYEYNLFKDDAKQIHNYLTLGQLRALVKLTYEMDAEDKKNGTNTPKAFDVTDLTWNIVDGADVAHYEADGRLGFDKPGTVEISATTKTVQGTPICFKTKITVKDNGPVAPTAYTSLTALTLTREMEVYDTHVLGHDFKAEGGNGDYLVFTSSDEQVVSIQDDGMAFAKLVTKENDPVTITARSYLNPELSATIQIKVVNSAKPLASVKFTKVDFPVKLYEGSVQLRNFLVTDPVGYENPWLFTWASSDPTVATVSQNGTVSFKAAGTAKITATYDFDNTKQATCTFTVEKSDPLKSIAFLQPEYKVAVKGKLDLGVQYTTDPSKYTIAVADGQWSSSNPSVATVDQAGIVTGKSAGTATITLTVKNIDGTYVSASTLVTVESTSTALESLAFTKSEWSVRLTNNPKMTSLYFIVEPFDAALGSLRVESSDDSIVQVVDIVGAGEPGWDYGQIEVPNEGAGANGAVRVLPVRGGTATISIVKKSNGQVVASTVVKVNPVRVQNVAMPTDLMRLFFYKADYHVAEGVEAVYRNQYVLFPTVTPADAVFTVRWETTDASVAFVHDVLSRQLVDEGTVIEATGVGSATVTMVINDGVNEFRAPMQVIVTTQMIEVELQSSAKIVMKKGAENTLKLTAYNKKTDEELDMKWTSSNKKVATVDRKTGLVTAKDAGEAVITATTKDGTQVSASCTVTVVKNPVTSISAKSTLKMKVGAEKTLKIKVKPSNAYDPALKFKSSNKKVVTVDANGNLVAKKAGEAVITVKTTDGSKLSIEIDVIVK